MTGIERLRELAELRVVENRESVTLRAELRSIADQIDRELDEHARCQLADYLRVRAVERDMERHVLGHEGMEDSPVARWARELREALSCHEDEEVEDVATIRKDAYDAYEWVSGNGGLEKVRALNWFGSECACIITGRDHGEDVDANEMLDLLRRRLMPEGVEWPRYEDNEPVRIGDVAVLADNEPHEVESMEFFADKSCKLKGKGTPWMNTIFKGQVAKRPAPKVLDADGVEIRVGDKLYDIKTGFGRTVRAINANKTIEFDGYVDRGWIAKLFTHRAPVLAADGKPLREGETVWDKDGYGPLVIARVDDETLVKRPDGFDLVRLPEELTHTKLEVDTWERIKEDATLNPWAYADRRGIEIPDYRNEPDIADVVEPVLADVVFRCRALAERDA